MYGFHLGDGHMVTGCAMRRLAFFLTAAFLFSCHNPLHETEADRAILRVRAASGSDISRTVVADFSSQIDEFTVTLTSVDGYVAPAPQTSKAAPWQVSFNVPVGSWNIDLVARRAGVQVASGSRSNVALTSGLVDPVIVPLVFGEAPGSVRFTVSVPTSTSVDYVHGLLGESPQRQIEVPLSGSGGKRSGILEFTNLSGGTYPLVLTFKRGGAGGNTVGVFREMIIVTPGFTSGSWVGPGGALLAERAFSEMEFANPAAALKGLSISGGVLDGSLFAPATLAYDKSPFSGTLPTSVTFTAAIARNDQYLEYSWNGDSFKEISSGTASSALTTKTYNCLGVRVTAPDRSTKTVYWVTFGSALSDGGPYSLDVPGGTVKFTVSGGEATITGFTGTLENIAIPASIGGRKVTTIAANAFKSNVSLTSLTIPSSVTAIGNNAFQNCTQMTTLIIPNSVTSIGQDAIASCQKLTSVTIPASITDLGIGAYSNLGALKSIVVPETIKALPDYLFFCCYTLTSITLPAGLQEIGDNSMEDCHELVSIFIPESVTDIGAHAFRSNPLLKDVSIPSKVKHIGMYAFEGCPVLTSVVIPASVTNIDQYAFQNCQGVTSIRFLSNTPPTIELGAFNTGASPSPKFYVPKGAYSAYKAEADKSGTPWSNYGSLLEEWP